MTIECAFFGSLARDAEAKKSKNDKDYLRASIRVENGERAQHINAVIFDPDAIAIAAKLVKDARVYVEGKLSLNEWTGQDGVARQGLSVLSFHCRLSQIGRNKTKQETAGPQIAARSPQAPLTSGAADLNDDLPF